MNLSVLPPDGLQALDDRQEFHAVVRREAESARHLHLPSGTFEDNPITARAGVSA